MTAAPIAASTSLFKGGPTLLDLLVDVSELRFAVTGPGMLFEKLELVTTLSALDGCTVGRLRELADTVEGTVHCGLVGIDRAEITVVTTRSGGRLEVGLGPPSMYQSELVLRTRTGEPFGALVRRLLSSDPARPFVACLHPVTADGHLEHHHPPAPEPDPGTHDHSNHGGEHYDGRP